MEVAGCAGLRVDLAAVLGWDGVGSTQTSELKRIWDMDRSKAGLDEKDHASSKHCDCFFLRAADTKQGRDAGDEETGTAVNAREQLE